MDRHMLIRGFAKIFVPLASGSVAAALVGMGVATLLGIEWHHALFKIIVPIMAGGVGEGAIPLSVGYAGLSGGAQGDLLAEILPAVMFGSLTAVLVAGSASATAREPRAARARERRSASHTLATSSPAKRKYTAPIVSKTRKLTAATIAP